MKKWGSGTYLIPAPYEVDEIMKKVPKGKLITINEIRETLESEDHKIIKKGKNYIVESYEKDLAKINI